MAYKASKGQAVIPQLSDLQPGLSVRGLSGEGPVQVVQAEPIGDQAVNLTFRDADGRLGSRIVFANELGGLEVGGAGRPWSFDADGDLLKLASEAHRIGLAHLFDPYLAISTSLVEPLPHQITAVYGEMLPRQPLRFLLADDPGAGKTIMAGLLIKELIVRGDLKRCLVVAPGNLVEQWQDEMGEKFGLTFDILTRDRIEAARTGNPFQEGHLWIVRLDQLSRNEDLQAKLDAAPEFDLIVCDEAHRMAATYFGGEARYTKRYQLGQRLSRRCRHFLLMSATPHNGKEADFQLFLALLDGDRFEGRFRDGVHTSDAGDLMRRLTKEELLKFDGTPLFPERRAYTVAYDLSPAEAALYKVVTDYVRDEMNRAERFATDDKRRQNVGFALQILQRRLASSPAAIHESLKRRLERLRRRLEEEELLRRGGEAQLSRSYDAELPDAEDPDDLDDAPQAEVEALEERVLDRATAARTIAELKAEIATLERLEAQARELRRSGTDTKWRELNGILDHPLMTDERGHRRKLIVFTEPRDTLEYLAGKVRTRLGRHEAVVVIHGGIGREERRKSVEAFLNDPNVLVMVANDAAGEGVNLQRAHLMVNYDLAWNPNRIEQRFGRIHRIGQTEVCHLWNLVAHETREGQVYARLLEKLETARAALGGRVFDVLGRLFEARPLRELLIEAIRYGERPEIRARLFEAIDQSVDRRHLLELLEERALAHDTMDASRVRAVRAEMERANAQRLQPYYIQSFVLDAFEHLGGRIAPREAGRFEVIRVPGPVRERDRQIGTGAPVLPRYERVCFDKAHIEGRPRAAFVCPGHPLFDATRDLILERHRGLLRRGAVLVDEQDEGAEPRLLLYLRHAVQDGRAAPAGGQLVVSERLQFVEMIQGGEPRHAGPAPYLDLRAATVAERQLVADLLDEPWLGGDVEAMAVRFAIARLVPQHLEEVRARRLPAVDKVEREVTRRLKQEIMHWDHRAQELKAQERAGKRTRLSSENAQRRADELADRLQARLAELERERAISALPPVVQGGALVVPIGLLRARRGEATPADAAARAEVERLAMAAVVEAERRLGFEPRDVSVENRGYDIESYDGGAGKLRLIEVKGRAPDNDTITVTRNEILCALNANDRYILAIVEVGGGGAGEPRYLRRPFEREPDRRASSINYPKAALLRDATPPC